MSSHYRNTPCMASVPTREGGEAPDGIRASVTQGARRFQDQLEHCPLIADDARPRLRVVALSLRLSRNSGQTQKVIAHACVTGSVTIVHPQQGGRDGATGRAHVESARVV
jgi:hypothetical protein